MEWFRTKTFCLSSHCHYFGPQSSPVGPTKQGKRENLWMISRVVLWVRSWFIFHWPKLSHVLMLKCRRSWERYLWVQEENWITYRTTFQSLPQRREMQEKGEMESPKFKFKVSTAQREYRNPGLAVKKNVWGWKKCGGVWFTIRLLLAQNSCLKKEMQYSGASVKEMCVGERSQTIFTFKKIISIFAGTGSLLLRVSFL